MKTLQKTLQETYKIPTAYLSLDDLYLTNKDQKTLAKSHPNNPLIQHRGQPGTHDLQLAKQVFSSLKHSQLTHLPRYDKSRFGGEGDRVDLSDWPVVNTGGKNDDTIKLVIFEGWCVGFRPYKSDQSLYSQWIAAVNAKDQSLSGEEISTPPYNGRLGFVHFDDIKVVNDSLKDYDGLTELVYPISPIFIHC